MPLRHCLVVGSCVTTQCPPSATTNCGRAIYSQGKLSIPPTIHRIRPVHGDMSSQAFLFRSPLLFLSFLTYSSPIGPRCMSTYSFHIAPARAAAGRQACDLPFSVRGAAHVSSPMSLTNRISQPPTNTLIMWHAGGYSVCCARDGMRTIDGFHGKCLHATIPHTALPSHPSSAGWPSVDARHRRKQRPNPEPIPPQVHTQQRTPIAR